MDPILPYVHTDPHCSHRDYCQKNNADSILAHRGSHTRLLWKDSKVRLEI